jgi:hypothetical protein
MNQHSKNYDCYPDCWEYNKPYAFKLFKKKITYLLNQGITLEELKHQTEYFSITLEFLIVGNYGEYMEEFSYSFPEEAVQMFNSNRMQQS